MGYAHPDYLMPMLSGPQFTEWQAYGIVEGFRPLEAVLISLLEGLGPKPTPRQNPEDIAATLTSIAKQFGAKKKGEEAKSEKRKVKKKV